MIFYLFVSVRSGRTMVYTTMVWYSMVMQLCPHTHICIYILQYLLHKGLKKALQYDFGRCVFKMQLQFVKHINFKEGLI